jgi:hypothetical protein
MYAGKIKRPVLSCSLFVVLLITLFSGPIVQAALEPIHKVEIGPNAEIRVNGQPFLPIMLWAQSESGIVNGLAISANTFVGNAGRLSSRAFLDALAQAGLYGVVDFEPQAIDHTHLLGWLHRDEPDLPGSELVAGQKVPRMSVDEVAAAYHTIKQADTARPVFLTFTAHFMHEMSQYYTPEQKERIYPPMVQCTDVVGFDMYPIYGWNKPEWLYRVADGVSELRTVAGAGKPVYAWIETNKGSTAISAANQLPVTPEDTRAEVWMALIRGATAIGYFTHSWTPTYTQFAPDAAMMAALKQLNAQITRLAPALLADPAAEVVGMTMSPNLSGHFKQTKLNGNLWIFAQNIDMSRRTGTATFQIPGLKAGALIEVVDEERFLVAQAGAFSDTFAPLQEHVYRIRQEPYVLIRSPRPQEQLTGVRPIDFQVMWDTELTSIRVEVDGSVVYTGDRLPALRRPHRPPSTSQR